MDTPNSRAGIVERIGTMAFRRRRLVVALWPVALAVLVAISSSFGGEFRQSFALPGSETQAAADRLAEAGFAGRGGHEGTVVVHADDVTDPAVLESVQRLLDRADDEVDGVAVYGPYGDPTGRQISTDRSVAFATLDLGDVAFSTAQQRASDVVQVFEDGSLPPGTTVEFGGDAFAEPSEFSSEGLGLLAAVVILLVAFGSVLAMGLPVVTALVGIGCGAALVGLAANWIDVPPFAPATVAMLGIGVGIDYALFIVTRYREELDGGSSPRRAVARSMATAGRSTAFAGATVVTSLLGLLLVGLDDVRSLAVAASAGVGFVMLASITVLPALLGFVGHNIDRFGLPHRARTGSAAPSETRWHRWSRTLQRRPAAVTTASLVALLLLSAPVFSLRLGLSDASARPTSDTSRRAHDLLTDAFGAGSSAPLLLSIALPDGEPPRAALGALAGELSDEAGVAAVSEPAVAPEGGTALVVVTPTTGLQDGGTADLVRRLRNDVAPDVQARTDARVLVGGAGAAAVDFAQHNRRVLPGFIGVVLVLSLAVLTVLFRSVLVPVKAVLVNLLSVGAAYGVIVAVFQWGWGSALLSLGEPGPVEAWVPMMLFAIVFGLSIDYEVFLLSRIRERYEEIGDNSDAVADGLARTARLIAAAAAIMVCVFGAFVLSSERALQMLGLGLAVAIAVDATIVRLVLVPATMELLGDRNWWLPPWLDRLLPGRTTDRTEPDRRRAAVP